nr:hypothetical protein [Candidatus Dependentiae bacterium]
NTVSSVAFSPDGKTVLTGSNDGTARLWDIKTGEQLKELIQPELPVRSVAFSPDGTMIAIGLMIEGGVVLWKRSEDTGSWAKTRKGSAEELFIEKGKYLF